MKARVRADAAIFLAVIICGLVGLWFSKFPVDKTVWSTGFIVFAGWLLIEVCFISAYKHAQQQQKDIDSLQRQIAGLLSRKDEEREDVRALRGLKNHLLKGGKIEAEITGHGPPRRATNEGWNEIERWWRSAINMLNQDVFSSFISATDLVDLGYLEDDEEHGFICIKRVGDSPAHGESLAKCMQARLARVGELVNKIEGKIRPFSPTPDREASPY